jgi:YHS domain-containing protein
MFKILSLCFIIFFVYVYIKKKKRKSELESNAIELVRDPSCNIYVNPNTPYKVKYYEKVYYFCSEECQSKFIENKKQKEEKE